ncbi:MAG: hypothetical protein JSV42_01570 [Chloroflexota bacterium]|nr:MAG: hypothetical protein JSV42_01570 [Chloroflexota bacterium]
MNLSADFSDGRLDRWSRLARLTWYPVFVAALGVFLASIPGYIVLVPRGFDLGTSLGPQNPPLLLGLNILTGVFSIATVFISFYLALVLFSRRPDDRMALYISYFLVAFGVLVAGPTEALQLFLPSSAWQLLEISSVVIMLPMAVFLFAVFPDGRFVPGWTRWLGFFSFLVVILMGTLAIVGYTLMFMLLFIMLYAQIYRYRHISTTQQKQQTKWFVYGFGIILTLLILVSIPQTRYSPLHVVPPNPFLEAGSLLLYFFSIAIIPITLTIAVMRYRLYEIDILINRTLVYGVLSLLIAGLYVLVVGGLGILFQVQGNLIISLLATGLVAVIFQPLRERIQHGVNRLFFGERDDPMLALSNLGEKLETALPPDEVLPTVVRTVASTLKLPYVAISLRENDGMKIAAEFGKAVVETISLPLVYQGERIGQMLVALRSPREPFSPNEMRLLSNVARQAGAAAHAVELTADLRRSRERLVTAREEERRRLRRDLHDGLGPTMASQTLMLDAALDLILGDPTSGQEPDLEKATKILKELRVQTQENVKNIRQIVYALRPPALDDLGLIPAIETHIEQITRTQNRLHISMEAPVEGLPPLSAAVELAIYRITIEALTNVINHAQARDCTVRISVSSVHQQMVNLDVTDDGVGLPENLESGIGLSSMRERAEELGGVVKIESSSRMGTRVSVKFPISLVE